MKVAILSESPADETAVRVLAEGVLGCAIERVLPARSPPGGWPAVRNVLRPVLLQMHYHTDADGLLMVVDSNGSPPHQATHDTPNQSEPQCRLCQLLHIRDEALRQARPRQTQPPLKTAFGLAVPCLEAWLLCDMDPHLSEATWLSGLASGRPPYTPTQLKRLLYGTDRPSLALETERMTQAAERLKANLASLESKFPNGFGFFVRSLRAW